MTKTYRYELTGNTRGRPGWFGKYVMQVEKKWQSFNTPVSTIPLYSGYMWLDATWEDVYSLGVKAEVRGEK